MEEPPPKRLRVEDVVDKKDGWDPVVPSAGDEIGPKYLRERDVGITEYSFPLKWLFDSRYSDFVVDEIGLDGKVVKLENMKYQNPQAKEKERNASTDSKPAKEQPLDLSPLTPSFSPDQITQLEALYTSKDPSKGEVVLATDLTKDQRTTIHGTIRTVFAGKLDSQATPQGGIRITYAKGTARRSEKRHWPEGEFCHFTCKKNNRDTMSTAALLAKWLKCHNKVIGYAGTKDRRAVTTQRMSAHRMRAERLAALNAVGNPVGIFLGDFQYATAGVKLGDLKGNKFTITLREVPTSTKIEGIERVMGSLRERGFINYYGMQRFGTSLVSTHSVGALLLNGLWKEACEAILDVKAGGMNDSLIAREAYVAGDLARAFELMPRNCIAERAILGVLKGNPKHFAGAFQAIPRNLRLMYVHAYQSYVWNVVASARIKLTSTNVLEGDLVLVNSNGAVDDVDMEDPDEGGEFSLPDDDTEEKIAVKVLTAEEVASDTYTIHDIVLPTPGYDVAYPAREDLRQAYVDSMSPDGLDPFNMRRVVRETSMVGHYRRVVHRPEDVQWDILRYNGRDTLLGPDAEWEEGEFMALRVQLRLGTSQYATMALREICKRDSVDIQFWGKERDDLEKARKAETTEAAP